MFWLWFLRLRSGIKGDLTPELKATYSASGASHVLALSGLHIGILAGILTLLLYPLRLFPLGRSLTGVLTVLLLWAFAFLSGLSASVVRAVTMFSLYVGASFFLEGRFSGFLSLSLAAFLMLLYRPFYLFDVSFHVVFSGSMGNTAVLSCILRLAAGRLPSDSLVMEHPLSFNGSTIGDTSLCSVLFRCLSHILPAGQFTGNSAGCLYFRQFAGGFGL